MCMYVTTNNRNRHGLGYVKCQEWTDVTQRTSVAVTAASDIDYVLVKRRRLRRQQSAGT